VSPPRFPRWLAVRDGAVTEVAGPAPDGVPLLDSRAENDRDER
jgi:hypothetical protein